MSAVMLTIFSFEKKYVLNMDFKKSSLLMCLVALFLGGDILYSQEQVDSLTIYFRQGYSSFDRGYRGNGERYDEFVKRVRQLQEGTNVKIWSVALNASASPDGSPKSNERLAANRASVLSRTLHQHLTFADSVITVNSKTISFEALLPQLMEDPDLPCKDDAIRIIQSDATTQQKAGSLKAICGQETWKYLMTTYFPDLRSFTVEIISSETNPFLKNEIQKSREGIQKLEPVHMDLPKLEIEPNVLPLPELQFVPEPQPEQEILPEPVPEPEDTCSYMRKFKVKTNALGWGFLMTNAAFEIDIIKNLSFAIPVYYSGWDYFVSTAKFRTVMIQPEIRYYIPKTNGLYVGAHFGLGYWNIAYGGDWRYQDHKGESPAIGGGLGLGYAMQFKKNPRWGMEFALGAGAYDTKYDVFYNEENGPYHKVNQRNTFIGIDNASVSFTYTFDADPAFHKIKESFSNLNENIKGMFKKKERPEKDKNVKTERVKKVKSKRTKEGKR